MSRSKSLAGRLIALFISALMIVGIMAVTSMADSPKILELGGEYEEGDEILFEAMTYVVFFQERHGGTYDIYRLATSEEKVLKVDSIEYSEDDDGYIMVIEGLNNYFTIPSDYLGKDVKAKILRGDGTQNKPFIFTVIPAEGQTASAPLTLGVVYNIGDFVPFEMGEVISISDDHFTTSVVEQFLTWVKPIYGEVQDIKYSEKDKQYEVVFGTGGMFHEFFDLDSDYIGDEVSIRLTGGDGTAEDPYTFEIVSSDGDYTGWQKFGDYWYYLLEDYSKETGWYTESGSRYYFDEEGRMQTGWQNIEDVWFYFGGNGVMRTGWQSVGEKWYYFTDDGAMTTGWMQLKGTWYYFGDDGVMQTGWVSAGSTWYYFAGNGAMVTGWKQSGGVWYYLKTNGSMATGFEKINKVWYYFGTDGVMKTGWQKVDGQWYYFEKSGAMKTGWHEENGKTYYFKADGVMATDWCQIDNIWYHFGENGVKQ